jgi:sterol desaturase/sphingolipid hydroxylase (fatty acid hydroxylase superfamily)
MLKSQWYQQKYHLDRMSFRDLMWAYVSYPGIQVYFLLLMASGILGMMIYRHDPVSPMLLVLSVVGTFMAYPFVEYGVHRFILHGRYLYRSRWTAALWKRIHYDHHQDPNDLRVLFGSLSTTLPTIIIATLPIGMSIAGWGGVPFSFATGLTCFMVYELCHCMQHLRVAPKNKFLRRIKRHHLLHHFHNEQGNFGITSMLCDRIFGSLYGSSEDVPFSQTVSNLGYANQERSHYPWVAQLSEQKP